MPIKTIIGQPARGNNFYPREHKIEELWRKIESGSNILMVAPRRVGKTSMLYKIIDNPKKGYRPLYLITESVGNENEFFRKLYEHVFELLDGIDKFSQRIRKVIGTNKIIEITKDGVKLETNELDYSNALIKLFEVLDLDNEKLIIMIDEFAETVENIIKDENDTNAVRFLQRNREIRHLNIVREKALFIYAGSIGLENVVKKVNSSSSINDLNPFKVTPFTEEEAKDLIYKKILKNSEMPFEFEQADYLLARIEWLMPFYIQLILEEIYTIYCTEKLQIITNSIVDRAIENAIQHRLYFDLWLTRLRKSFEGNEFKFVKTILNETSEKSLLTSSEIYNYAQEFNVVDNYKDLINILVYDGYINNDEKSKEYRFNSPILKIWWNKYVAN